MVYCNNSLDPNQANSFIIGRGLIIHSHFDSCVQPTGDAGSRIYQGVIGYSEGNFIFQKKKEKKTIFINKWNKINKGSDTIPGTGGEVSNISFSSSSLFLSYQLQIKKIY